MKLNDLPGPKKYASIEAVKKLFKGKKIEIAVFEA